MTVPQSRSDHVIPSRTQWLLGVKPLKSLKLNRNQNGCTTASAKFHFKGNFSLLSSNLPPPFLLAFCFRNLVSPYGHDKGGQKNEHNSYQTQLDLYFSRKPWRAFLRKGLQFLKALARCSLLPGKAIKLLFLFIPGSVFKLYFGLKQGGRFSTIGGLPPGLHHPISSPVRYHSGTHCTQHSGPCSTSLNSAQSRQPGAVHMLFPPVGISSRSSCLLLSFQITA